MNKLNTTPVNYFDINRYLGLWYQIATIPSWFQKNLIEVKAQYSLKNNGKIEVLNSGINKNTGRVSTIVGSAKQASSSNIGWLKVSFFFFPADYFILELSPSYDWALVGGSDPDSLWILSRENKIRLELFNQLRENARNRGYNVNKLIIT